MKIIVELCSFLVVAGTFTFAASAHSWYDSDCCSNEDCVPVLASTVRETPRGFVYTPISGRSCFFPKDSAMQRIRKSKDGEYHVCITKNGVCQCIYKPDLMF